MSCKLCSALRQYGINLALWADDSLSVMLGGKPGDTISRRTARARDAGEKWAKVGCAILTWIQNKVFRAPGDHCTFSEGPGSIGAEVWDWSPQDEKVG